MTDHRTDSGASHPAASSGGHAKVSAPHRTAGGADPRHMRAFKEFWLTSFAIDHPTSTWVLTVILVIAGLWAYATVPKESFPNIVVPNIIVNTVYPGVAPQDMETLITRPIEDELNTIGDVKTITSTSSEGFSSINAEFEAGMDMNEALQRVREKVDLAKPELPAAAEEPQIIEINFSEFPIMQVNIAGPYGLVRLRDVAEDVQDRLEQIPSILEVRIAGGLEREVKVDVDLARLKFYDVTFDDVIEAVRQENLTVPGGSIDVGELKYLVRVPGEFETTDPIADIVVDTRDGRPIYVRDVADVEFGFKDRDTYARLDGEPVISLSVVKRSGENIVATAAEVRRVLAEAEPTFPPGTIVKTTSDMSKSIAVMVVNLENNIIFGLILVVSVLLFVIGARSAPFVGLAIPLSMLISFTVFQASGITLNMVVLFSLILALGMLVDNAIVVVEVIYRFRERRFDRVRAAKFGTGEVAIPIITSTLTTLAAFLPMVFWPGMTGEFMKFLPLTLIITLTASLFVALIIVPMLASQMLDTEDIPVVIPRGMRNVLVGAGLVVAVVLFAVHPLAAVLLLVSGALLVVFHRYVGHRASHWVMQRGLPGVISKYERMLRWALAHRARLLLGTCGTFVLVVALFVVLNAGVEFFPEKVPPETVYVQVEAPLATRVEETDRIVRQIEDELRRLPGSEDFESVVATVGSRVSAGFSGGGGTHLATVAVHFVDYQDRAYDAFATLGAIRRTVGRDVSGAAISVEKPEMGPPTGRPITIEITGEDPAVLKRLGEEAITRLENSPIYAKLDGLRSDMKEGRPELLVAVDREKAALYGLSTRAVGGTIRNAINGAEASTYRDGKDEYDITVRLAPAFREELSSLGELTVSHEGRQIPLSSVASWAVGRGSGDVRRKDLDRVVTVGSDVREGYNGNAVLREVARELDGFRQSLPNGYGMRFAGEQQEQAESQAFLGGAFVVALLLILLILISEFDSITKPLIIMTSVIMSTIGVLLALIAFRMPFGIIMTGVGVISLAGVVVNNAIVLMDYIGTLRKRDGMELIDAIVTAGKVRFRPVILTAVTTVLGLLPMAIGLNIDFLGLYTRLDPDIYWGGEQAAWWGPMAIVVIAGLTLATFLTLVLVPVMYAMLEDFDARVRRLLGQPVLAEAASGPGVGGAGDSGALRKQLGI